MSELLRVYLILGDFGGFWTEEVVVIYMALVELAAVFNRDFAVLIDSESLLHSKIIGA